MTTLHSLQNLRKPQTGSVAGTSVGSAGATASTNKRTSTKSTKEVTEVRVPRYDKALRNGRGDILPKEQWAVVTGTLIMVHGKGLHSNYQLSLLLRTSRYCIVRRLDAGLYSPVSY